MQVRVDVENLCRFVLARYGSNAAKLGAPTPQKKGCSALMKGRETWKMQLRRKRRRSVSLVVLENGRGASGVETRGGREEKREGRCVRKVENARSEETEEVKRQEKRYSCRRKQVESQGWGRCAEVGVSRVMILVFSPFGSGAADAGRRDAQMRVERSQSNVKCCGSCGEKGTVGSRAVPAWCDEGLGRTRASMAVEGFEGFSSADALRAHPCSASSGPVGSR